MEKIENKEKSMDDNIMLAAGKFQVAIKTSVFRGDHCSDIMVALDVPSTMTVGELIHKVFEIRDLHNANKATDHIEIRACSGL